MRATTFLIVLPLLLGGCATTVIDYDPENMELPPGIPEYEPTPDRVELGDRRDIVVKAVKTEPFMDVDQYGNEVERQVWQISATNRNKYYDQCVTILWRLMEFKLYMDGPSEFLIPATETHNVGMMVGQTWKIDGVKIALPPSGYIQQMRVRRPNKNAKEGEECLFLPNRIVDW